MHLILQQKLRLRKNLSLPLIIFLVNVSKPAENCGLVIFTTETRKGKPHFCAM